MKTKEIKNVRQINSIADIYKREYTLPVLVSNLLAHYDYYGDTRYIDRIPLYEKSLDMFSMSESLKRERRPINGTGHSSEYRAYAGLSLAVKALRDAGCLLDKKGVPGKYKINENMYRYLKEKGDEAIVEILDNFEKKKVADLANDYVKKNPKIRGILIKKAKVA